MSHDNYTLQTSEAEKGVKLYVVHHILQKFCTHFCVQVYIFKSLYVVLLLGVLKDDICDGSRGSRDHMLCGSNYATTCAYVYNIFLLFSVL